jgi:GDPmannose 4,6-dehydratase
VSAGGTRALITGVAGQDGSYLAELLVAAGVEVHGVARRPAALAGVTLHVADVSEPGALRALVEAIVPGEIHHLAAPTFVPDSWADPQATMRQIVEPAAELIDAVRAHAPTARLVYACTREIFAPDAPSPQDERTPFAPASPYGEAKLAAHRLVVQARERDGLHASSAILFNHTSPRHSPRFLARRVAIGAARIAAGLERRLVLGDLDAVRDWSAAVDVVAGLAAMARAPGPGDYVLASGVGRTVRRLAQVAFACVGLDAERLIEVDETLVRPRERTPPIGDPSKARRELRWEARVTFEELIGEMVAAEVAVTRS